LKNGAGQHGQVIIDDLGRLVWFNKNRSVRDFRVQRYGDRPVLTWWEGVQEWCQRPPTQTPEHTSLPRIRLTYAESRRVTDGARTRVLL
jgi:hypothetical protein